MRVIISAAGTGGHINPAIAIANKIREKEPNSEILFIGTNRGLENDLVPRAGYELKHIEAYGFKKQISYQNFRNIIETLRSSKKVKKIIDEFKPDLVIGTGGYICGPVFLAAISKKIPTVLHESNAYPGKAVKMFSRKVDVVLVGLEDAKEELEKAKKVVFTGTPTKIKKKNISESQKEKILSDMGIKNNLPIVLIFGGSQGAQKINEATLELIKMTQDRNYQIVWATGQNQYDEIKDEFGKSNISIDNRQKVKILPYIYNMEEMLNICDLAICRSGAMTVTEIANCGKPAIFIPLPSHSANRQEDNARVLEKVGAARVILNNEITAKKLSNEIDNIIYNKIMIEKMGKNANQIAVNDVEEKIYNELIKILR